MIQLQSLLPEAFSKISKIQKDLEVKYSDVLDKIWVFQHEKPVRYLELNVIKIKTEFKNQGWGSKILNDICVYADENSMILSLTPSDTYGSSVNKLKSFYKKFQFQPNRGPQKHSQISDSMIRLPK